MILLHTALAIEARPLRDFWNMKQVERSRRGTLYATQDPDLMLVVSGTGALAAASAVSAVLARYPAIEAALNMGLAGCPWVDVPCGGARYINQLHDASSGRTYYPDSLYRHDWKEASLTTYGQMMTAAAKPEGLVDMEGSGFFVAARASLPAHRIALLKIVSDHLEGLPLDLESVRGWISGQLEPLDAFLRAWTDRPATLPALPATIDAQTSRLAEDWGLTVTQRHQLHDAVNGAFLRGRRDWSPLQKKPLAEPSKRIRNRALNDLCDELAAQV